MEKSKNIMWGRQLEYIIHSWKTEQKKNRRNKTEFIEMDEEKGHRNKKRICSYANHFD